MKIDYLILIAGIVLIPAIFMIWRYLYRKAHRHKFSFKDSMELTQLPIIIMKCNNRNVHFLLDTGSDYSFLNESELKDFEYEDTDDTVDVYNVQTTVNKPTTGKIIKLNLDINDKLINNEFVILDMTAPIDAIKKQTGVTVHGVLGTKFFESNKYIIDFENYEAYSKK